VFAALAGYAPAHEARLEYEVLACLRRMDAYYLRDRQVYRRGQGTHHEIEDAKTAPEALHAPASSQLTVSDAVLQAAEDLSVRAVEVARSVQPSASAPAAGVKPKPSSKRRTEGLVWKRCASCESGARPLARAAQNMRYPPFVLGCTCHFAFDWEGEPLGEADYEAELTAWAAHWVQEVSYPFPTRLVLFKLAAAAR